MPCREFKSIYLDRKHPDDLQTSQKTSIEKKKRKGEKDLEKQIAKSRLWLEGETVQARGENVVQSVRKLGLLKINV